MYASAEVWSDLHPEMSATLKLSGALFIVSAWMFCFLAVRSRQSRSAGGMMVRCLVLGGPFGLTNSRERSPEWHESETQTNSTPAGTAANSLLNSLSRIMCVLDQSKSTGQITSSNPSTSAFGLRVATCAP